MAADLPSGGKPAALGGLTLAAPLQRLRAWSSSLRPAGALRLILALAFLEGLLCFVAIPPWWHYDEPGHFEYAWLVAHLPQWPVPRQYDQDMRRQMAKSMLRYDWYTIREAKPDLKSSQPIPIGVTQVGDQPGYYFLASLPLRLMPGADITLQYLAVRSVSLVLFLLIIVVVWCALAEILPPAHPLRWMTTAFVALLPAFADSMTSVNNDVAAVLAGSLALWACLRLIRRGFSIGRLVFLALSLAACYLAKSTAWFMFGLAPIALLLAFFRGRFQAVAWGAIALAGLGAAILALTWNSPRAWFIRYTVNYAPRIQTDKAPLGSYAFQFENSQAQNQNRRAGQLKQVLPPDEVQSLRGETLTLGGWVWGTQQTQGIPFFIRFTAAGTRTTAESPHQVVPITTTPVFHAVTFTVPQDAVSATVFLPQAYGKQLQGRIFFDGLVLAPGALTGEPHFASAAATRGEWNGQPFVNMLRNGSAEAGSFGIRKWVQDKGTKIWNAAGVYPGLAIAAIQDWSGNGWYYRGAAQTLFRTFWASLAGDKAVLPAGIIDFILLPLTVLGILGALALLWLRRRSLRRDVLGFLLVAFIVPWIITIARGSSDLLEGRPLFPWARYSFPAILPMALLLSAGWFFWLELLAFRFGLSARLRDGILLGLLLAISFAAILNALRLFRSNWWDSWISLVLVVLLGAASLVLFIRALRRRTLEPPAAAAR